MDNLGGNHIELARIISANLYMCVATATKTGTPWISQVYFVTDQQNNFYWYSGINTRHSNLISNNPRVALSIYDSHAVGDTVYALYVKAICNAVTEKKTLIQILGLYASKMFRTGFIGSKSEIHSFTSGISDFLGNSQLRFYKATPYEISLLGQSTMINNKFLDHRNPLMVTAA
ncbi:pyridoxamine 5'-phosphate oxidase family protein [bacterium]|nr:pyridoxamine 5'-phosphate oxidase family protein [bacterium]